MTKRKIPKKTEKEHVCDSKCEKAIRDRSMGPFPPKSPDIHRPIKPYADEGTTEIMCSHPDPKPIVIGTPFSVHLAWFWTTVILCLAIFILTYGPNWRGAFRP